MPSLKTAGIVLKGTNFGEADKILTIFTLRFGKIKAIAKGVRKIRSHMAGSLEPFALLDLQLHEGKTFYIVTGAVIDLEFSSLHLDLKKIAKAFFLGELVDRLAEEGQKLPEIFDLFIQTLDFIEKNDRDLVVRAFELKMVEAAGFKPELYSCVHCKEKITPGDNFWDSVEGGAICGDCHLENHHGSPITDDLIKLLRFIEKNDLAAIIMLKKNQMIEKEAEQILADYIRKILDRELKSRQFLNYLQ